MARPKKDIDPAMVHRLAKIHCTVEEIAAVCHCDRRTLERRFARVLNEGRDTGKASLRRMQWKAAKAGNTAMLIWLGKQLLGQRDRQELTGEDGGPVECHVRFTREPATA